jgi:hypothetical protein
VLLGLGALVRTGNFTHIIACLESNCNCIMEKADSACHKSHVLQQNHAFDHTLDCQSLSILGSAKATSCFIAEFAHCIVAWIKTPELMQKYKCFALMSL